MRLLQTDTLDTDDLDTEEGVDVEDKIAEVEEDLADIFDNQANGDLLSEILDQARVSYEKDSRGWDELFFKLQEELMATDDEDNAKEILDNYRRKAKLELS